MTMLNTLQDLIVFFMVLAVIIIGIRVLHRVFFGAVNIGAHILDVASDALDAISARRTAFQNRNHQLNNIDERGIDNIVPEVPTQRNPRQRGRPIPVNPRQRR